ncbi:hypothetical protein [Myxococcus stipitatus]|uniref:hypothetical protein n=1 Tax=Myxococcus stipitatus TaxID=83455 RepID=UPI0030CCA5FA
MSGWVFVLAGVGVGLVQSRLLASSVRGGAHLLSLLLRLGLVGAVLFLSARAGHLASGAAGWFAGFVAASVWLQRRMG